MTQAEKQLLLKDLSARLPYRVKVLLDFERQFDGGSTCTLTSIKLEETPIFNVDVTLHNCSIEELRPYLRPISSMTEDEKHELYQVFQECPTIIKTFPAYAEFFIYADIINSIDMVNVIDWLNAHHFDYRGLIEKDLAIEAPDGMYETL